MAIDIMSIEPNIMSRDLSGYIFYLYGQAKVGKSYLASKFPSPIFASTEKGYNCLPGIYAIDITAWADIKQIARQLKTKEAKQKFKTVVLDTVDIAATMVEKYICNQNNVTKISDIPYGSGWSQLKKEFEETFRTIVQNGYGLIFISHSKEATLKRKDGSEYNVIRQTAQSSVNSIAENMADIIGYMYTEKIDGKTERKIVCRSTDDSVVAGSHFKYFPEEIDATYEALVKAIQDAIDKEAAETDSSLITNNKIKQEAKEELDFDKMMEEFSSMVNSAVEKYSDFAEKIAPGISHIIENYLGVGKKVSDCTRAQVEQLQLINIEVKDYIAKFEDK